MKRKNYFYILLEIIAGFFICYSICILPFFYFMYPKFFDQFFLGLQGLLYLLFIITMFFFPAFISLALVRFVLNNKISYFINFILFESYGYWLFVYSINNSEYSIIQEESLLYVLHTKYFIYSIPMTVIFLLIVFMIDVNYMGIKLSNGHLNNEK